MNLHPARPAVNRVSLRGKSRAVLRVPPGAGPLSAPARGGLVAFPAPHLPVADWLCLYHRLPEGQSLEGRGLREAGQPHAGHRLGLVPAHWLCLAHRLHPVRSDAVRRFRGMGVPPMLLAYRQGTTLLPRPGASRVGEGVTPLAPHRSGRADFPHPAPHQIDSRRRPLQEAAPVPWVRRGRTPRAVPHRYPSLLRAHAWRVQCPARVSLRRLYHDVVSFPGLGPPGGSIPGADGTTRRSDFPLPIPDDLWIRRPAPA